MACACACLMCACTSIKNIKGPVRYRPLSFVLVCSPGSVPIEELAEYRRRATATPMFRVIALDCAGLARQAPARSNKVWKPRAIPILKEGPGVKGPQVLAFRPDRFYLIRSRWLDAPRLRKKKCVGFGYKKKVYICNVYSFFLIVLTWSFMAKTRWIEILEVAVQILKLVIKTAADIVDDGRINGSVNQPRDNEEESGPKY